MSDLDLAHFPLLADLAPEERERLAEELDVLEIGPGFRIFGEGDPSEALVWIAEGRVRVTRTGAAPAELGAGETLGAFSLLAGGVREATAETVSRSRLYLLRRGAYERLRDTAPRAACGLLEAVLRENALLLRATIERFGADAIDRARARR